MVQIWSMIERLNLVPYFITTRSQILAHPRESMDPKRSWFDQNAAIRVVRSEFICSSASLCDWWWGFVSQIGDKFFSPCSRSSLEKWVSNFCLRPPPRISLRSWQFQRAPPPIVEIEQWQIWMGHLAISKLNPTSLNYIPKAIWQPLVLDHWSQ